MTQAGHIFRELGHNLTSHSGTAFVSFLSLGLLYLLFDVFWVAAGTSERFYEELLSDLTMEVFVAENVPDSTLPDLQTAIAGQPGVQEVSYVSRQQARDELARMVGTDLLVGYDESNPLPRSYILSLPKETINLSDMDQLEQRLRRLQGVDDVIYSREWLEKAEGTRTIIFQVGTILGAIILITALLASANNIRLMTRTRAVGLTQMRLLGAGRLLLSVPFVLEGLLISFFASAAGWLVVLYGAGKITFSELTLVLPRTEYIVAFCIAAALVGAASAYLGVGKMMRHELR